METNYINMAREVEKLRGELMNPSYVDRRPCMFYFLCLSFFVFIKFFYTVENGSSLAPYQIQLQLMEGLLETTRMRLLLTLWDKMPMKMATVLPRFVIFCPFNLFCCFFGCDIMLLCFAFFLFFFVSYNENRFGETFAIRSIV